jgi:hypothetical protein
MVKHDFTIHAGQDFNINYVVPEDSDRVLTGFHGVCKIRKRADEGVIFELNAEVGEKYVTFSLSGATSAAKKVNGKDFVYDAFIYNDVEHIKLGYGKILFIQDISMHD